MASCISINISVCIHPIYESDGAYGPISATHDLTRQSLLSIIIIIRNMEYNIRQ